MILKTIQKLTDNFEKGFTCSTLMGWIPNYDKEGRPLNCDPNFRDGTIIIEDTQYWFVRRRWRIRLWDRKADYMDFMNNKEDYIEELDITPDYVKEYNEKKNPN